LLGQLVALLFVDRPVQLLTIAVAILHRFAYGTLAGYLLLAASGTGVVILKSTLTVDAGSEKIES
jgi:hypothetical protein